MKINRIFCLICALCLLLTTGCDLLDEFHMFGDREDFIANLDGLYRNEEDQQDDDTILVALTINPEMEFVLDRGYTIQSVRACNADAEDVLEGRSYTAVSFKNALTDLFKTAQQKGYVKDGQSVAVTVKKNKTSLKQSEIVEALTKDVTESATAAQVNLTAYTQAEEMDEELADIWSRVISGDFCFWNSPGLTSMSCWSFSNEKLRLRGLQGSTPVYDTHTYTAWKAGYNGTLFPQVIVDYIKHLMKTKGLISISNIYVTLGDIHTCLIDKAYLDSNNNLRLVFSENQDYSKDYIMANEEWLSDDLKDSLAKDGVTGFRPLFLTADLSAENYVNGVTGFQLTHKNAPAEIVCYGPVTEIVCREPPISSQTASKAETSKPNTSKPKTSEPVSSKPDIANYLGIWHALIYTDEFPEIELVVHSIEDNEIFFNLSYYRTAGFQNLKATLKSNGKAYFDSTKCEDLHNNHSCPIKGYLELLDDSSLIMVIDLDASHEYVISPDHFNSNVSGGTLFERGAETHLDWYS